MKALFNAVAVASLFFAGLASAQIRSENPQNFVGEQHNIALECLQRADPEGKRPQLEVLVYDCGFKTDSPAEEFIARYTALTPADLLVPLAEQLAPHREQLSEEQLAYLLKAESILQTQSPEEAALSLEQLEAQAVKALGREASDLAALGGLSTARHSLYYWTVAHPRTESVGAMRAKWWQVVLADVAGGIVGGIFGGGVGAVGLGGACSGHVASLK